MEIKTIKDVLLDVTVDLTALKRSTQTYSVLTYQHEGNLLTNPTGIKNETDVSQLFLNVIQVANDKKVDLFVTPEYSCPLRVLERIVGDKTKWPVTKALWILCLESITKEEMQGFFNKYNSQHCMVHFETKVLESTKTFLDSACYIFIDVITQKLILVFQFKTKHMGPWSPGADLEKNHLIQGNDIYILKNTQEESSISLVTLICSEAMNFPGYFDEEKQEKLQWADKPFLFFNPQCNPDPYHEKFTDFRKFIFETDRKEILCLNWNIRSRINGKSLPKYGSARSGFHVASSEVENVKGTLIKKNHKLGLYYFHKGLDKHSFILNGLPQLYLIQCPPVLINGLKIQSQREGPTVLGVLELTGVNDSFIELREVDDNHIECIIKEYSANNAFLTKKENCIFEKERLVCLTSGKVSGKKPNDWHQLAFLQSFQMDNRELNSRITFTEDTHPESLDVRSKFIQAISDLESTILPDEELLPLSLLDLKGKKLEVGYTKESESDRYKYNLISEGVSCQATICYLGLCTPIQRNATYANLRSMFDEKNERSKSRVVVYYKVGAKIECLSDDMAGKISGTYEHNYASILK